MSVEAERNIFDQSRSTLVNIYISGNYLQTFSFQISISTPPTKMMIQAILVLASICNAVAFAPSSAMRNTRSMQMSSTEKMVGASIEVNGGVYPHIIADNSVLRRHFVDRFIAPLRFLLSTYILIQYCRRGLRPIGHAKITRSCPRSLPPP